MIRCNALDRQMSSDEVEKDVLKLIMNALFGNFLQNNENYTETNTFTDCEKWLRATWKICGDKRHFDIVQGSVSSEESFLGPVTSLGHSSFAGFCNLGDHKAYHVEAASNHQELLQSACHIVLHGYRLAHLSSEDGGLPERL